ncbi:MAG: hypothetical protein HQL98_09710 [Magnetococcales bacterium]|nr:hypothetical protein [Magnetococcales bacterium]
MNEIKGAEPVLAAHPIRPDSIQPHRQAAWRRSHWISLDTKADFHENLKTRLRFKGSPWPKSSFAESGTRQQVGDDEADDDER